MPAAAGTSDPTRRPVDERLVGLALEPLAWRWDERDVALYALAVGAGVERDLALVYEGAGPLVLPSFATVAVGRLLAPTVDQIEIDLLRLLHLDQTLVLAAPLPAHGRALVQRTVLDVVATSRATIVCLEDVARGEAGEELFRATSAWRLGGASRGRPRARAAAPVAEAPPDRAPDAIETWQTSVDQAALYRLCGDLNPLHIDPRFAAEAGFEGPLLHGLCTFGAATLAAVRARCGGDPVLIGSIGGRFVRPVAPGDELRTELWWTPEGGAMRTSVGERVVLDGVRLTLRP